MDSKIPNDLATLMGDWHSLKPGDIVYEASLYSIYEHEVKYIEKYSSNRCKLELSNRKWLTVKEDSVSIAGDKYGNNKKDVFNQFFVNYFKASRAHKKKVADAIERRLESIEEIREEIIELKQNLKDAYE